MEEKYFMDGIYIKEVSMNDSQNWNIYEMLQDIGEEENGFRNSGYGIGCNEYGELIKKYIKYKTEPEIEKGYVPQTIFWLFDGNEVIGYSKMRSYLTDNLRKKGGHIGYGIRKAKRNRGYGKILLRETIKEIEKAGVKKILLTSEAANTGSRKVIESNGGILEKEIENECYYWIIL